MRFCKIFCSVKRSRYTVHACTSIDTYVYSLGRFIRNQMKGEGVEMITVMVNKTRNETEERLERYDMGEEYLIHM